MKKQILSTLCVTAATALVMTGCAPKPAVSLTDLDDPTVAPAEETAIVETTEVAVTPEVTPVEVTPEVAPEATIAEPAVVEPVQPRVLPQPVIYTVTPGDSISGLAVRFNLHKPDILALNPGLAKNPNAIRIGQKIKLPAGTDITVKAKPRAKAATTTDKNVKIYTVKAGDVLGTIALRHSIKVADIKAANNLKKDTIFVGQKLKLPGAKPERKIKSSKKSTPKKAPAPAKEVAKKEAPAEVTTPAPAPVEVAPVVETVPESTPDVAPLPEVVTPLPELPKEAEVAAPAENTTTYIVKEGEDLLAVACRWNISVSALREANKIDDAAGYVLTPGTTLIIPSAE